jgi:hypothetical protein
MISVGEGVCFGGLVAPGLQRVGLAREKLESYFFELLLAGWVIRFAGWGSILVRVWMGARRPGRAVAIETGSELARMEMMPNTCMSESPWFV